MTFELTVACPPVAEEPLLLWFATAPSADRLLSDIGEQAGWPRYTKHFVRLVQRSARRRCW